MSLSNSVLIQRLPVSAIANKAIDANAITPITLYVKSVTVLTSGTPSDIATIPVPVGITRYHTTGSSAAGSTSFLIAETATATLAGANFTAWDAAGGTGNQLISTTAGPTASGVIVAALALPLIAGTGSTVYIRQTANSANAGTISFYITIFPIL